MQLDRPVRFGVAAGGRVTDLAESLTEAKAGALSTWSARYAVRRPGDHVFFFEPAPYWEPAEERFIVHYTKVVVHALGLERGWEAPVGLPTEIVPLTRPYGLWTGNVFQGEVRVEDKPVPFAEVEVEFYNEGGQVTAPNEAFITQVIKADANGVFCYTMPRAGWWGFSALVEGDQKMNNPEGDPAEVELGGLIWER